MIPPPERRSQTTGIKRNFSIAIFESIAREADRLRRYKRPYGVEIHVRAVVTRSEMA